MKSERIAIFDTTLRDGEQSPGCSMYLEEKTRMARQLELLGVDVIEAGFPIASEGDFQAVRAVSAECRKATIAALARTVGDDIYRAADAAEGGEQGTNSYIRSDVRHPPAVQTQENTGRGLADDRKSRQAREPAGRRS